MVLLGHDAVGQHVHNAHPPEHHGKNRMWYRIKLEGPGHTWPTVKLQANGNYMIFNEWLINSTCNDNVERGNTYSRSVTHSIHVEIEGEVSWEFKAGAKLLAAELKAQSRARVQLSGGWQGTWKEELSFSSKTKLKRCQRIWYVFLKNRRRAVGHIHCFSHKITCRNSNTQAEGITYCSLKQVNGTGVGWGTHIGEHVQRGLTKDCPCADIDPDSKHVFEPSIPVAVPEPEGTDEDTIEETPDEPAPREYKVQNPISEENAK